MRAAFTPGGDRHENLDTRSCGRSRGGAQRVCRLRAAEAHIYAQLGRRRRPCAVFLRAEDGLVQRRRRQRRLRDRSRLCRLRAEGRGGRFAARSLRHGRRSAVPRQGLGPGRADEHLCQLAAGPLLAEELRHQVGQGSRRQEDRQSGRRRRPHALAGAGEEGRHRSELGDVGEYRRQRQARRAQGEDGRRHHLVLQSASRVCPRAWRRHGLPGVEGRRHQSLRQFDHRQRRRGSRPTTTPRRSSSR